MSQASGRAAGKVQVRKVFDNGMHNAFTSLARWRNRLYLAFRTAESHVNPDAPEGVITLLVSEDDGASWSHLATFTGLYGKDLRDTKLLATSERLYLHTFEYQCRDRRDAMVTWTEDGVRFVPVQRAVHEENHVIWWPVHHGGRFFATGYRYSGEKRAIRTAFFTSGDGVAWRVAGLVSDVPWSNEAALVMEEDGTATALVRNDGERLSPPASDGRPVFARAAAPYTRWTYTGVERKLKGLALLRVPGGYVIAARDLEEGDARTACFFCDERRLAPPGAPAATPTGTATPAGTPAPAAAPHTRVVPRHLFTLPSGGDTAYAGFVREGRRVLMSYYSSHEYGEEEGKRPACIYLAEFNLDDVLGDAGGCGREGGRE